MRFLLPILALLLALVALISAISIGLDKSERVECFKLQKYSERYADFYITEWQDEMCQHQGIPVYAPVK